MWGADTAGRVRNGIATAVVVGPAVYLVDCGRGATTQFAAAGLSTDRLRGVFLTHLHSDHTVDLAGMLLFGWMMSGPRHGGPVPVIGPGDRGMLPLVSPRATGEVAPLTPQAPTAGTVQLVENLLAAYSTDVTDRMLDSLRPSPYTFFAPRDVAMPEDSGYSPNLNPSPSGLEPFTVFEDDLVHVTATLVVHPPVAPAFAFRVDTEHGSVTISGDTAPSSNLVRLAAGTDLLLHEAIDMGWAEAAYRDVDAATREATLEHHRKSHTTPRQAGQIAAAADVGTLALHHLVPGNADECIWREATETFSGPVLVPEDLQSITVAGRPRHALASNSL